MVVVVGLFALASAQGVARPIADLGARITRDPGVADLKVFITDVATSTSRAVAITHRCSMGGTTDVLEVNDPDMADEIWQFVDDPNTAEMTICTIGEFR